MAAGTRAMFAPYISEDLRLRVLSLLYVGVSVETIMQRHNETVERQGGPSNRDDLLTHRYVRRQERAIRRSTYELDSDDSVSITMWVETHRNHVFFYEDFSDSDPFTLGIQTEWQLQQMIRFGNRSLLVSDSKFGTNKLKYPIHSLLVFNSDKKAIPVAWIITPRFSSLDSHRWMRALYNRVHTKDPAWKLAGFIVDDPLCDVLAIRDVFQCSVLISFWRVRHALHKNIVKKCLDTEMQAEISRHLGQIVDKICRGQGTVSLFEDFMEDFVDQSDFMDYFKATWYPRIGRWTSALKTLPLASQETCAAIEFYHNQLKIRLLNEKNVSVYQRADWLVDKLGTKVHSYFWLDEYTGKDDFARYWKNEWASGLTSWRKSLKIADSDVVMVDGCAKVVDQLDQDEVYVVWNPGSMFGICDCNWAQEGNLCEHILKVISVCQKKRSILPSISLFQYHRALIDMLHCPPSDSLIRDHAVSLAVSVQKQLNALLDSESRQNVEDPIETQTIDHTNQQTSSSETPLGQICHRNDASTCEGDGSACGSEAAGLVNGGFGDQVMGAGEDMLSADMDVDPSSICISPVPPGLHSVDEAVLSNVLPIDNERALTLGGSKISSKNDAVCASPTETSKHCTHQNMVNGKSTVISDTIESDVQLNVEPPVLDVVEDESLENMDVDLRSNNT
ncbi:uncharacterized protein LOC129290667 isoform X3 [Prosopis cineraria]|nr:uncharacterized protein LOC129290667 isoform X3 [Prosopis cineraria]